MRLPWIQVDSVVFEQHAPLLARLLGVNQHEALGLLCCLWRWVLCRGSDDAPSGTVLDSDAVELVEAGAGWEGKRGLLVRSLLRAELVEKVDGGLRIRGLDRYAKAWERQQAERERVKKLRQKVRAVA